MSWPLHHTVHRARLLFPQYEMYAIFTDRRKKNLALNYRKSDFSVYLVKEFFNSLTTEKNKKLTKIVVHANLVQRFISSVFTSEKYILFIKISDQKHSNF